MKHWKRELEHGRQLNEDENYSEAQQVLESALHGCPDEEIKASAEIIFEIGRSFFGRGMRGIAIKNMLAAARISSIESHTDNMIKCLVNEYGMPAQKSKAADDEAAFTAVQLLRYLSTKKSAKFGTLAEKDMVLDLVSEAWSDFKDNYELSGLSARQKVHSFKCYVIIFPSFSVPDSDFYADENIIFHDFGNDSCSCGSGLPYMWCCGRIKSLDEIENGK